MITRCPWATSPLLIEYHDTEWGRFTLDDRVHFEHLCLEGFQAGLSWETVLKKRENLRRLFAGFDREKVAAFGEDTIARILEDTGGIRNRAKVRSAVNNAARFVTLHRQGKTFSGLLLDLLGSSPIDHRYRELSQIPAFTEESVVVSKALKKHGFTFVGPTIIYAHLQAMGLVNDHLVDCFVRNDSMLSNPPVYGG
ncbi:MAG: DNA-3-methyladenine glycosylase I [Deltaproteobacteria bacterium]|nr:DNA-3-methyladenine glycosylase I [Candidatus Zymogenaceae bacterium]